MRAIAVVIALLSGCSEDGPRPLASDLARPLGDQMAAAEVDLNVAVDLATGDLAMAPNDLACGPAGLGVNFATLDFGAVKVGQIAQRQLVVVNTGAAPVSMSMVVVGGRDASAFLLAATGPIVLAGCQSRTLPVTFEPLAAGRHMATYTISPQGFAALMGVLVGTGT